MNNFDLRVSRVKATTLGVPASGRSIEVHHTLGIVTTKHASGITGPQSVVTFFLGRHFLLIYF